MKFEPAPIHHDILAPEAREPDPPTPSPAIPPSAPEELPWHKPLDLRLRAAVRTGGLLTLLVAGVLLGLLRAYTVMNEAQSQVRTETRAVAASVASALSAGERGSAFDVLSALAEKRHISGAALYDLNGKSFADYAVSNALLRALPRLNAPRSEEPRLGSEKFPSSLVVWEPVKDKSGGIGWLVLEADLSTYWRSVYAELAWTGAAMLIAVLMGAAWVGRMQQRMTEPMLRLARTAKVIAEDRDYTLRAWKDAHDEAGSIAGGFNQLLDEIQRRGAALVAARLEIAEAHRMRLEAQSKAGHGQSLRLHTQFLANMCHEIRTPMNRAASAGKQLALTQTDARQQELLTSSRGATEHVLSLVDDLLDYTRIESGKLELLETVFDPSEIAQAVVHIYQERAQSRQIKLSAQLIEPLPTQIKGDPARLRQVIGSLVGNAIKFSQGGEISIELSCAERTENRVRLLIQVKDSGIGIAEEARMRIYKAFSQADEELGIPSGSVGLGLSIARHLVRRMGGELHLDGTAEKNSGFRFTLSVEEIEGPGTSDAVPQQLTKKTRKRAAQTLGIEAPTTGACATAPSQWEQVVEVYLDSAQELVDRLTSAIERDDVEHACSAARTLGTCSAKVGASDMAALCNHIEKMVQDSDFPTARSQIRELTMTFEQTKTALRRPAMTSVRIAEHPGSPQQSISAVA